MKRLLFYSIFLGFFCFSGAADKSDDQAPYTIQLNNKTGRKLIVSLGDEDGNYVEGGTLPVDRGSKSFYWYRFPADQVGRENWGKRKCLHISYLDLDRNTVSEVIKSDSVGIKSLLAKRSLFKFNAPMDNEKYIKADIVAYRPKDFEDAKTPELIKSAAALKDDGESGVVDKKYGVPGLLPIKKPGSANVVTTENFAGGKWWWRYGDDADPDTMSKKAYKKYIEKQTQEKK